MKGCSSWLFLALRCCSSSTSLLHCLVIVVRWAGGSSLSQVSALRAATELPRRTGAAAICSYHACFVIVSGRLSPCSYYYLLIQALRTEKGSLGSLCEGAVCRPGDHAVALSNLSHYYLVLYRRGRLSYAVRMYVYYYSLIFFFFPLNSGRQHGFFSLPSMANNLHLSRA